MAIKIPSWIGKAALGLGVMIPAITHAIEFNVSGFGTFTAGKVMSSAANVAGDYNQLSFYNNKTGVECPCYIAAPVTGGVYDRSISIGEESRLGLQGEVGFTDNLSFTGQAVVRKIMGEPTIKLEWAYFTYKPTSKLTLQFGRKRLPLFYYSDFQDVSFALPWARVPSEAYRWPINNYYGVSAQYQTSLPLEIDLKVNGYVGQEDENMLNTVTLQSGNPGAFVRVRDMKGVSFEFTRDWLSYKMNINQNTQQATVGGTRGAAIEQGFYSWALNADYKGFVLRTENAKYIRYGASTDEKISVFGIGYAVTENIIPMFTQTTRDTLFYSNRLFSHIGTAHAERVYSVRYNVNSNSSFKFQYERKRAQTLNASGTPTADSRVDLASVTYDFVF